MTAPIQPIPPPAPPDPRRAREVFAVCLRIGATAFGGPAAHIAIMRDEFVRRRKWIEEQHFLDLLGATNLIPGPNSSEMAMHIGYLRAGLAGLLAGGLAFLLPALLLALVLAWTYVEYGTMPAVGWLLYGVKPVIIPIVAVALWSLTQKAVKGRLTAAVGIAALALYFAGINFVALLLAGGLIVAAVENARRLRGRVLLPLIGPGLALPAAQAGFSLWKLFLVCLKIGSILYGSGYVLFAFFKADLVERYGWLTEQQLIDAIAVGQLTPGPLFSSATFIGYLLGGVPGALLATAGLYIPAFVVVALSNPLIPRIRRSKWAGSFLDGVNVASLGIMAAVTWELGRAAFVDPFSLLIGGIAAAALIRFQVNSAWLVLFGALMGLVHAAL